MNINEDKIFLTIELGGKLRARGKYTEARISLNKKNIVKYCGIDSPEVIILERSKTLSGPKYHKAHKTITLGEEFLKFALERPKIPFRNKKSNAFYKWLNTPRGKFWKNFNKLSEKEVLDRVIQFYVEDMEGRDTKYSYEVM